MNYYLPPEIQRHINEYAKPVTRPDWRKGSFYLRQICKLHLCYIANMHILYKLNEEMMLPYRNMIPYGRLDWRREDITEIIPIL